MHTILTAFICLLILQTNAQPIPSCVRDTDCPTSSAQYCQRNSCNATSGLCAIVPDFCSSEFDPVCGCDGLTYSNACLAATAKTSVDYLGECMINVVTCLNNSDCSGGEFCQQTTSCFDVGFCNRIPTSCPPNVLPVCGCNGLTYLSECEANMKGVSVDSRGPCPLTVFCGSTSDCPEFFYCKKPVGVCTGSTLGKCIAQPDTCSTQYDPVCGCNGKTYTNGCFADLAGISIYSIGLCNNTSECSTDIDCTSTQLCVKDVGTCGDDSIVGLCVERPEICRTVVAPVCGCDNITYTNDCYAYGAGSNIAYTTACSN